MIKKILFCAAAVLILFISSCPSPLPVANILMMHTVAYNANGGTGMMTSDSVMQGGDYNIKTNSFNRDGYLFSGWNTAANGNGDAYAAGATIQNVQGNVTLYAQWSLTPMYTVTYVANGGTGTMTSDSVIQGGDYNIKTNSITRVGYFFIGWNTAANGSGDAYAAGAVIQNVQRDVILYAQWSLTPMYTVTYVANGGTGTIASDSVMQSGDYNIKTNSFTRVGYLFSGWNTAANGNGDVYAAGAVIQNVQGDITLYAQWKAKPMYTVVYVANGGTGTMDSDNVMQGDDYNIKTNSFTRVGYFFSGWNTAANGSGDAYAASAVIQNVQEDIILYAQWKVELMYTVAYISNGGTGTMASDSVMRGNNYNIKTNSFTRVGYFFSGWNTAANGNGDVYAAGAVIQNVQGDIILYAQWSLTPMYTVTYVANGGTGTMASDSVMRGNDYNIKTNSFTRDGYLFSGWNTAANGSGNTYAAIAVIQNVQEDIILYAQWKAKPLYTVAYIANGGTGTMTSDSVKL